MILYSHTTAFLLVVSTVSLALMVLLAIMALV